MRLSGAGYDPLMMNAQSSSLYEQVQKMRVADAELRSEARRIQARANANGQSAATQVAYGRGPDGKTYITSITITRTETVTIGQTAEEGANPLARQPLQQDMADISPARMPFSPSEMAEGFGQKLAESLAQGELQDADAAVRNHEGLHFRTAGGLATGLPELEYIKGPDGQYYAVAGEVHVQTAATSDSAKASRDAATYARAATAPGDASAQDMQAARSAFATAAGMYGKATAARNPAISEYDMVA